MDRMDKYTPVRHAKKASYSVGKNRATSGRPRTSVSGKTGPASVVVGGAPVPVFPFRTEVLIEQVGSLTEVAVLLGVDKSQPTRWRKGEAVPSPEKARLLTDLEHVFSRAALIFEPDVVRDWMTGPNAFLEGARPIDVLRTRGVTRVLDALDAAEQVAFG